MLLRSFVSDTPTTASDTLTEAERKKIIDGQIAAGHFDAVLRSAEIRKQFLYLRAQGATPHDAISQIKGKYNYLSFAYINRIVHTRG